MKVKKGDSVLIISGKDKGKVAKILRSLPKEDKILVEGVNLKSKHVKPKRQGEPRTSDSQYGKGGVCELSDGMVALVIWR